MIKVRIGKETLVYSDEDLSIMTLEQLKQLKQDLQCNMEEVAVKKTKYQAENDEDYNSKEYFKQIAKYKSVMVGLKRSIAKVNVYCNILKEEEHKDNEHWLWSFYMSAKNILKSEEFENLVKMADEKAKYHIEIGE